MANKSLKIMFVIQFKIIINFVKREEIKIIIIIEINRNKAPSPQTIYIFNRPENYIN